MSCYMVNKETIDAIVYGARKLGGPYLKMSDPEANWIQVAATVNPDAIGQKLWWYNLDSVCDRYSDEERDYEAYVYKYDRECEYNLGEILGALRCYTYQACDEHTWDSPLNEVRHFCNRLKEEVRDEAMRELGYEVPWGIGGHNTLR